VTLSPKHLSFDEMWKLYKLLEDGVSGKQKEYLIDEVSRVMEKITQENYLKSLSILYDNQIEYRRLDAIDSIILFIDGLNFNKFFDFCSFVGNITNGTI
jgi:hypothetical protein